MRWSENIKEDMRKYRLTEERERVRERERERILLRSIVNMMIHVQIKSTMNDYSIQFNYLFAQYCAICI